MIHLLSQRDTQAFSYLYDSYSAALFGIILKIVKNEKQAEEILHDAFLRIWDRISDYKSEKGKLFTWMLNVSRNMAIDYLRSKASAKASRTDGLENSPEAESEDTTLQPEFLGVKDVLEQLPPEQKQLVDLMYFQGYSQTEISEEFNIPLGTVKTRVRSAMQKLREIFS